MKRLALTLLVLLVLTNFTYSKPGVKIIFKLDSHVLTNKYGVLINDLETKLSSQMAAMMSAKIPVFRFSSTENFADVMTLSLTTANYKNPLKFDIRLTVQIAGINIMGTCPNAVWNFAVDGEYNDYLTGPEEFVLRVMRRMSDELFFDSEKLISRVLKYVCIKEEIDIIYFEDQAWEFKSTYSDLEIGSNSEFGIVQTHQIATNSTPRTFLATVKDVGSNDKKIFAELLDPMQATSDNSSCKVTFDDRMRLRRETYQNFVGFHLLKLTKFSKSNGLISPSNAGTR